MTLIPFETMGSVPPWAVGVATFLILAGILGMILGFGATRPHS